MCSLQFFTIQNGMWARDSSGSIGRWIAGECRFFCVKFKVHTKNCSIALSWLAGDEKIDGIPEVFGNYQSFPGIMSWRFSPRHEFWDYETRSLIDSSRVFGLLFLQAVLHFLWASCSTRKLVILLFFCHKDNSTYHTFGKLLRKGTFTFDKDRYIQIYIQS